MTVSCVSKRQNVCYGENKQLKTNSVNIYLNFAQNLQIMYPEELVTPMKSELTENGFKEMLTAEEVENEINQSGTTLVVINSVCGCSAGSARPGVLAAVLHSQKKPDRLVTSFAGYDVEAVQKVREYLMPYPPSSPSIALFKDGELVSFIERHHIEGRPAELIAQSLVKSFEEHC